MFLYHFVLICSILLLPSSSFLLYFYSSLFLEFSQILRNYLGKAEPIPYAKTMSIRRKATLQYIFCRMLEMKSKRKPVAFLDYFSSISFIDFMWASRMCILLPSQLSLVFSLLSLFLMTFLRESFQVYIEVNFSYVFYLFSSFLSLSFFISYSTFCFTSLSALLIYVLLK